MLACRPVPRIHALGGLSGSMTPNERAGAKLRRSRPPPARRLHGATGCGGSSPKQDWRLGPTVIGHGRPIRVVAVASHPDLDGSAAVSGRDVAVLRVDPAVTDVALLRVAGPP
jgi:hypothetical protein